MLQVLTRVRRLLTLAVLLTGTAFGQADWFEVVREGSAEDVRAALQAGTSLEARDGDGLTPLMHAARQSESPDVVRVLLDAGAHLEARDAIGRTPLMHAARWSERPDVLRMLLDAGANPRSTDQTGRRAIEYARENEPLRSTDAYWHLNDASFD